jgi:cleavage and polyadenylation specificity factor subunit 2
MATLRNEGSVLLPVDASTRVLELTFLLDQLWVYHQLKIPVVFFTHQSKRTIEYAKGMLEWMGDAATKHFSTTRESPFEFK